MEPRFGIVSPQKATSKSLWNIDMVMFFMVTVLGDVRNAGTMTMSQNHLPGSLTTTLSPDGHVANRQPGSLPGCVGTDVLDKSCGSTSRWSYNDWVWYNFPTTCNAAVDYTFLSGNTNVLRTGCGGNLYPVSIKATFGDTAPPSIKINGDTCQGHTVAAQTYDPCADKGMATWVTLVQDDCNSSPSLVSSTHNSGDKFALGDTAVTVQYEDNQNQVATCTFTVTMTTGDRKCAALPSAGPSSPQVRRLLFRLVRPRFVSPAQPPVRRPLSHQLRFQVAYRAPYPVLTLPLSRVPRQVLYPAPPPKRLAE
jgi:hypothetical protein